LRLKRSLPYDQRQSAGEGGEVGDPKIIGTGVDGFVLGIDIGGTKVAMATELSAPAGTRLLSARRPTLASDGAEVVLERVLAAARDLVDGSVLESGLALSGIGVVCPGVIRDDGVLLAPNNPGWEALRLRDTFEAAFPEVPVEVMNDVKAAALAEATAGALAGVRSGIFVNLGTGLAAAIVIDGVVLDGAHGAAGEIAYQLPGSGPSGPCAPGQSLVYADGHAPLEEMVSGEAISRRASAVLGRQVRVPEAFAISAENPAVRAVVDDAVEALAIQIANLSIALDPERVVLGGGLMRQSSAFLPRIAAILDRMVPFPPEIQLASLPDDAALAGALVIAERARHGEFLKIGSAP
jgi:glucokinase